MCVESLTQSSTSYQRGPMGKSPKENNNFLLTQQYLFLLNTQPFDMNCFNVLTDLILLPISPYKHQSPDLIT